MEISERMKGLLPNLERRLLHDDRKELRVMLATAREKEAAASDSLENK